MTEPRPEVLADFLEAITLLHAGTATPEAVARLAMRAAERDGELDALTASE